MTDALLDKLALTENLLQLRIDLAECDRRKYFLFCAKGQKELRGKNPSEVPELVRMKRAWKKKCLFITDLTKRIDHLAEMRAATESASFDGAMCEIFELYNKTTGKGLATLANRGKEATDAAARTSSLLDEIAVVVAAPVQREDFTDQAIEEELEELLRTEQDIGTVRTPMRNIPRVQFMGLPGQ